MTWLNLDNLSASKSALGRLTAYYRLSGYSASYQEIQKLAYLLKVAGEPALQGLIYRRSHHGPYAYNLSQALEGMKGKDDYRQGRDRRVDRVSQLIAGFETPYGIEMFATLHWVAQEFPQAAELRGGDRASAGMERSQKEPLQASPSRNCLESSTG